MIRTCPKCGELIVVSGLGRKRLNIPLKNVCESLQSHRSVDVAAQKLNCSQGYIYQELKKRGLTPKEVIGTNKDGARKILEPLSLERNRNQ